MIAKYIIPVIAVLAFGGGTFFGGKLMTKKCPDCVVTCPTPEQCPPCNGIDFDKIKSKYITIENKQFLTVNGDSLMIQKISEELRKELQALRLARCK